MFCLSIVHGNYRFVSHEAADCTMRLKFPLHTEGAAHHSPPNVEVKNP